MGKKKNIKQEDLEINIPNTNDEEFLEVENTFNNNNETEIEIQTENESQIDFNDIITNEDEINFFEEDFHSDLNDTPTFNENAEVEKNMVMTPKGLVEIVDEIKPINTTHTVKTMKDIKTVEDFKKFRNGIK